MICLGVVLCPVGCSAASLTPSHPSLPSVTTNRSPDVVRCPLGAKPLPVVNPVPRCQRKTQEVDLPTSISPMRMEACQGAWLFIKGARSGSLGLFLIKYTDASPPAPELLLFGGGAGTIQDTPGCSAPQFLPRLLGEPSSQDGSLRSVVLNKCC